MGTKRPLRTDLITPMQEYFADRTKYLMFSDLVAISNLQRIHKAGYEFYSIEEFVTFLHTNFHKDGTWKEVPHDDRPVKAVVQEVGFCKGMKMILKRLWR